MLSLEKNKIKNSIKKMLLLQATFFFSLCLSAQAPAGYYDPANGKTGTALQQSLHDIIDNQTPLSYSDLWTAFLTTDKRSDGKVWDMYSDKPGSTPAYLFTFTTDQCGNYGKEGDCYNREHSFPKSWFSDLTPMYTDLFHLYPTDGYVNGKRSNYPFGEVGTASWTSTNGSKLGTSSVSGYTGIVFEPIDAYKGDFARSYFYMATRYYGEDSGWAGSDMVTGSQPKPWALTMLLQWNKEDPVSQKEIDRNNAVYGLQHNRNPFIDYPLYAEMIWGSLSGVDDNEEDAIGLVLFPNPATSKINIVLPQEILHETTIQVFDLNGCVLKTISTEEPTPSVDVSDLKPGYYLMQVIIGRTRYVDRFVVER